MGQVSREHGFAGKFLSSLCDPGAGLDVGCTVLVGKFSAASGDISRALQFWNGGANPEYASEVLARINNYK